MLVHAHHPDAVYPYCKNGSPDNGQLTRSPAKARILAHRQRAAYGVYAKLSNVFVFCENTA